MIGVFGSQTGAEELEELRSTLEAQWLGPGPKTQALERGLSARLGVPDVALLDSGSNALFLAVKLLGLPPGCEVVVPATAWIACGHAPLLAGLRPVFCDVDDETQNATKETVAAALTEKTKAVLVLHYAGLPAQVERVAELGLPVVEDAAHAVDSRRGGKACGTLGEAGVYSFDAVKNLTMGSGGGLTAKDPALVARAKALRCCGLARSGARAAQSSPRWWEYELSDVLPKMEPNDVAAAIGLAQLRKLDALQARRRAIWTRYQAELSGLRWLRRPPEAPPQDRHSYFTYCVRVDGGRRDELARRLYERGIYTTVLYRPLHLYALFGSRARLPVAERLGREALSLPLHPRLSDDDVGRVIDAVKELSP